MEFYDLNCWCSANLRLGTAPVIPVIRQISYKHCVAEVIRGYIEYRLMNQPFMVTHLQGHLFLRHAKYCIASCFSPRSTLLRYVSRNLIKCLGGLLGVFPKVACPQRTILFAVKGFS